MIPQPYTLAITALLAVMLGGMRGGAQPPRPVMVAAASDLQGVLPEVIARFERDTGAKVTVSFGSSGTFFAQVQNGAPFDVFFSADIDYPRKLVASGHADRDSLYPYATGHIALWTRTGSGIDLARGLRGLSDPRVKRIAIANPLNAPYGRAAVAALKHDQIYDTVQSKLVFGENIAQTAQLVDSGNADVGILALSLVLGPAMRSRGTYVAIPTAAHPPIEQAVVVLSASTNKGAARRFLTYVTRPDIGRLLERFGFAVPPAPAR